MIDVESNKSSVARSSEAPLTGSSLCLVTGQWIGLLSGRDRLFNVYVVSASGGESRAVSFLANGGGVLSHGVRRHVLL